MSGIRSLGTSPSKYKTEDSQRTLYKNSNNTNFFGNNQKCVKQLTKPFNATFEKANTNKFFSVERQSTEHTNYQSTNKFKGMQYPMTDRSDNRDYFSSENNGSNYISGSGILQNVASAGSMGLAGAAANDIDKAGLNAKQFKNELARKKIEYFTASAKNFILSSLKLKKFIENNRSSDVQYTLNLFEIDRENMEKSLRHLGYSSKGSDLGYSKIIEELREENNSLKMKLVSEPLKSARENVEISRKYEEEIESVSVKFERIERQLQKSEKKCSDRKGTIKKLYYLLEDKEKEVEALLSDIEIYKSNFQNKMQEIQGRDQQIFMLEKTINDISKQNQEFINSKNERKENLEELNRSILDVQHKYKIQCREDFPTTLMRWKSVRDFFQDRQKILSMQKDEAENEQRKLKDEIQRERERNLTLEERLTNYLSQLKQMEERERRLSEVHFIKDQVEKRLEETELHYENLVHKLETEIRRYQEENEQIRKEWIEAKEQMDLERINSNSIQDRRLQESQETWERRLQQCAIEWEKEVESREHIISQKQRELEAQVRAQAQSERKRTELQQRYELLEKEKEKREEEFDNTLQEQKRKIQTLTEEIAQKKIALKSTQLSMQEVHDELAMKKNEGQVWNATEQQIKEKIALQKTRLQVCEEENGQLRRDKLALNEKISILESKLGESQKELHKISEELIQAQQVRLELQLNLENQINANRKQIETLRSQLHDAQNSIKLKESAYLSAASELTEAREIIQEMKLEALRTSHKQQQLTDENINSLSTIREWQHRCEEQQSQIEQARQIRATIEEQQKKRVDELLNIIKQRESISQNMEEEIKAVKLSWENAERAIQILDEKLQEKEKAQELFSGQAQRELDAQHERIEELMRIQSKLENDLAQANLINDKLRKEMTINENQIQSLAEMNQELQQLLDEQQVKVAQSTDQKTAQAQQHAKRMELQQQLSNKEEECLHLQKQIIETETQLEKQLRAFEELQRDSNLLNAKFTDSQERFKQLQSEFDEQHNQITQIADRERKINQANQNLVSEAKKQQSMIEQLANELREQKQENISLKEFNDDICDKQATIQRENDRIKEQLEQYMAANGKLEEKIENLILANESQSTENLALKQERVQIEYKLSLAQNLSEKLNERVILLSRENEEMKLNAIQREEDISQIQQDLLDKEHESVLRNNLQNQEVEKLNKQVKSLKDELTLLKESMNSSNQQREDQLIIQLQQSQDQLLELQDQLIALRKENKQLSDNKIELVSQLENVSKRNQILSEENDSQQKELLKLREEKRIISDQHKDLTSKCTKLEEREKTLVEELEKLKETFKNIHRDKESALLELETSLASGTAKDVMKGAALEQVQAELKKITRRLELETTENANKNQQLQRELDIVKKERDEIKEKLRKYEYEGPILNERINQLQQRLTEINEQKAELQFKQDVLNSESNQLKCDKDLLAQQLEQQQKNQSMIITNLKEQNEEKDKKYLNSMKLQQQKEQEIQDLLLKNNHQGKEIQNLRLKSELQQQENMELSRRVQNLTVQVQSLQELNISPNSFINLGQNITSAPQIHQQYASQQKPIQKPTLKSPSLRKISEDQGQPQPQQLEEQQEYDNDDLDIINPQNRNTEPKAEAPKKQVSYAKLSNPSSRKSSSAIRQPKDEEDEEAPNKINIDYDDFEDLDYQGSNKQIPKETSMKAQRPDNSIPFDNDDEEGEDDDHYDNNENYDYNQDSGNNNQDNENDNDNDIQDEQYFIPENRSRESKNISSQLDKSIPKRKSTQPSQSSIKQSPNRKSSVINKSNEDFYNELDLISSQADELKQQIQKLKTENENLITQLQDQIHKEKKLQQQFDQFKINVSENEKKTAKNITNLEKQLSDETNKANPLKLQIQQLQQQLDLARDEIREQYERIQSQQQEIILGENQIDQQSQTILLLQDKIESQVEYLKHVEDELKEQKNYAVQLENSLEKKRKQLEESDNLQIETEQRLKAELALKYEYIAKLESTYKNKAELTLAQSQQIIVELQSEITRLKGQLAEAKQDQNITEGLKRQIRELQRQLREVNMEMEKLEIERQQYEDDMNLQRLSQQDISIKLEVLEMKSKNYFNMLIKILLALDSDIDEKVSLQTHSFDDLLSLGIQLSKQFRYNIEINKQQ